MTSHVQYVSTFTVIARPEMRVFLTFHKLVDTAQLVHSYICVVDSFTDSHDMKRGGTRF